MILHVKKKLLTEGMVCIFITGGIWTILCKFDVWTTTEKDIKDKRFSSLFSTREWNWFKLIELEVIHNIYSDEVWEKRIYINREYKISRFIY